MFQGTHALGMYMGPATTALLGDAFGNTEVFLVAGPPSLLGIVVVGARVPSGRG